MSAPHEISWMTAIRRTAIGTDARLCEFFAGLREFRRQQAAIERARHDLVIFDSATGICFGMHPAARRKSSAG